MMRVTFLAVVIVMAASSAFAAQSLIPTPYPSAAPGAAPLNPATRGPGGGQQIMRDPYPQTIGPNSQGNPPTARATRQQRLVPTVNQRKYGVDRPAR